MDRLCYEHQLISGAEPQYILVDFVSDMDSFRSAIHILHMLQKDVDRIKCVVIAYQEFLNLKESVKEYTRIDMIKMEMIARSFFVEFDVFLNHWEKRINRHPKREELRKLFNNLTHDAYDSSDNYAMVTIIRNYAIHSAGIINGVIWGKPYCDVSIWKHELMSDNNISSNKKKIINRQSSEFILLQPMMRGALDKLKQIHETLVKSIIDEETQAAMDVVGNEIKKIKEYGDKLWFFADDEGSLSAIDENGKMIEFIQGKCLEMFYWEDFENLIASIRD